MRSRCGQLEAQKLGSQDDRFCKLRP